MTKNIKDITMDEEEKLDALRQDFFSYYRRMRSNLFSDTEIVYETRLTTEVFDLNSSNYRRIRNSQNLKILRLR